MTILSKIQPSEPFQLRMNDFGLVGLSAAFAFMFGTSSCSKPETPEVRSAREFRDALATAIEASSRIEVVEHSDFSEFCEIYDPGDDGIYSSNEFPVVEYARVRLGEKERGDLLKTVRVMDPAETYFIDLCPFDPHHTIELYSESGLSSSLRICFNCDRFQWSARDLTGTRDNWMRGFESFIGNLGMRPNADWDQCLKDSGKATRLPVGPVPTRP